jgi:hypothetical protein
MALNTALYTRMHNKTGSDLSAMQTAFDNNKQIDLIDFPSESALIYQIQKMQEELDYLRTEIALNKAKESFAGPATTLSFGDLTTTTSGRVTTYSIDLTATKDGVSKSITLTLR